MCCVFQIQNLRKIQIIINLSTNQLIKSDYFSNCSIVCFIMMIHKGYFTQLHHPLKYPVIYLSGLHWLGLQAGMLLISTQNSTFLERLLAFGSLGFKICQIRRWLHGYCKIQKNAEWILIKWYSIYMNIDFLIYFHRMKPETQRCWTGKYYTTVWFENYGRLYASPNISLL